MLLGCEKFCLRLKKVSNHNIAMQKNLIEIYSTLDQWNAQLIQTQLNREGIQSLTKQRQNTSGGREIALFVGLEDEANAKEIVSHIDLVIVDSNLETEMVSGQEAAMEESEIPQITPADVSYITIADRGEIGKVVHHVGLGYELQVGLEPYYTVDEDQWEEFTDFSAQRQEFSILLRHEYPELFKWLKGHKMMLEFIRLIESTYRDVPPLRSRQEQDDKRRFHLSKSTLIGFMFSLVALLAINADFHLLSCLIVMIFSIAVSIISACRIFKKSGRSRELAVPILALLIAGIGLLVLVQKQTSSSREEGTPRLSEKSKPNLAK